MSVPITLRVKAKRAFFSCDADGDGSSSRITVDCSPAENVALEIGEQFVFSRGARLFRVGKRRYCHLAVSILRKSSLTEEGIAMLNLSADKIGRVEFHPAFPPPEKEPASLLAKVFVSDLLFDNLWAIFRRPLFLSLSLEKEGVIEYGWEPDGSRVIWKIQDLGEPSHVDISAIKCDARLFGLFR